MKRVICVILLIIVTIAMISINLLYTYSKKDVENITTTTTTNTTELSKDSKYDYINIEGMNEEILVKKYATHFGYYFYYQEDLFTPSLLSNGSIQIVNSSDQGNYVLIEKLNEEDYYSQYELLNGKEEVVDYYLSKYSFYRGNNIYLKITKCIKNDSEYLEGLNVRLDYIINSISFN